MLSRFSERSSYTLHLDLIFHKYVERLEHFFVANGIDDVGKKRVILLYTPTPTHTRDGPAAHQIYDASGI